MKLAARAQIIGDGPPFVARLTDDLNRAIRGGREAFLLTALPPSPLAIAGVRAVVLAPGVRIADIDLGEAGSAVCVSLPPDLMYLRPEDVVLIDPRVGEVRALYRRDSRFNSILLTERCNSYCVMCSQPPKTHDDGYLVQEALDTIDLMSADTENLTLTGGEPTLLIDGFLSVVSAARDRLPRTALHVLSNGRLFSYLRFAREVAALAHSNLVFGVPLYSDLPWQHDFVVQAQGAFDQTIRGMMNLARCGVRIELRVVVHAETYRRLPQLARFVARNLPFVEHVALMGLELVGFTRANLDALWIDPVEYQAELRDSVEFFTRKRMNVSIYNHQLCVLDRNLWPHAKQSISDWKRIYPGCCDECSVRDLCGGVFASAEVRHSDHLRAIP